MSSHDDQICNRQFLLTKQPCDSLSWPLIRIGEYHLYSHPKLECKSVIYDGVELVLLGYFFDYRHVQWTNADILNHLLSLGSFDALLKELDELSGRFVLIHHASNHFCLIHDACGQREVFYDASFSAFGSQPKIIERVVAGIPVVDADAIAFFQSAVFDKAKIFIADRTQRQNINRLAPNHYIDITKHEVRRYFPEETLERNTVEVAAKRAVEMLRGYLHAASLRYPLHVGVTAGYDSRILFLASMDLNCLHYVGQNKGKDNPIDVSIAQKLAKAHLKPIEVRNIGGQIDERSRRIQDESIDFPRYKPIGTDETDRMIINGNVSEIARNYYGYENDLSGAELCRMNAFLDDTYVAKTYEHWLATNRDLFKKTGYHYLDLFYWEEKMGNWASKGKTEAALNVEVYSPFSSRGLLKVLLSTDRKERDKHFNKLYDEMIRQMSPEALDIPVNPLRKLKVIKLMKRMGAYNLYRRMGIKLKFLRS